MNFMASASPFYYTVLLVCNTLKNLSTLSEIRYPHLFELPLSQDVLTTSYAQLSNYYLKIKLSIMKRFLLLLFAICSLFFSYAQENPCPDIQSVMVINRNTDNCTGQVRVMASGDVQSPKGLQVEVICGGTVVQTTCFIVPKGSPSIAYTTGTFTCACGSSLSIRVTRFTASNGACQGGTCGNIFIIEEIPLPVSLKSFSAIRNQSAVAIKWITSTESNNKGFNVQRNINGTWETVSFVPSAVTDGNSSSDLTYSFTDVNNTKGVTQYRIQQVDIDGRSKVSEIRSVKGEAMATNMIIYPNPSETGRINVVFEDQGQKNVQVSDMTGRVVRTLKGISNNVSIEGLESGVYSIKVTDLSSSALRIEKVVIKKR